MTTARCSAELRENASTLTISGLPHKPTVSFLRQFSAPVKVNYPRPGSELSFLARNDQDGFVRWDALQTMWVAHFDQRNTTPDIDPQAVLRTIAQQALTTTAGGRKAAGCQHVRGAQRAVFV
jgi:hypothetical protein